VASGARFRVTVAGALALGAGVALTVLVGPSPCLARCTSALNETTASNSLPSSPPWQLPWLRGHPESHPQPSHRESRMAYWPSSPTAAEVSAVHPRSIH
jgi:hypothetical protein